MQRKKITFIGAGNMARAVIGGLIADAFEPALICAADIDADKLRDLTERYGIRTETDNTAAVEQADIVILAVKPQIIPAVAIALREPVTARRPLVLSIAAGINLASLQLWLTEAAPIVRVMPNTPALVGAGAAALIANQNVDAAMRDQAEAIMRAVGLTVWLQDESLMDAVTALSGSGPAYAFMLMEAMEQAAQGLGLPADQARILTLQTVFGAAKLALEANVSPAVLRAQVSSPGGTTERAINELRAGGFPQVLARAISAASERSKELADRFGAQ